MDFKRKIQHGIKNPLKAIKYLAGGSEGKQVVLSSYLRNYSEDKEKIQQVNDFLKIDLKNQNLSTRFFAILNNKKNLAQQIYHLLLLTF